MSAVRVLLLRQSSGLYGADRAVLALAGATPAAFAPVVGSIVRPGADDALGAEAAARGIAAVRFDSAGRFDVACARAVAREARARGIGLLHAHDFKSLFVAVLAGAMARLPVVATYHGDTAHSLAVRAYELVGRVLSNFTRGVAAVSRTLERKLRRTSLLAPVVFVPNGLPLPRPASAGEREAARERLGVTGRCIAVVGRLSPEKGHEVLLRALREVPEPPTVLCAGDGPLRESLAAQAHGLDVRFLGFVSDVRAVMLAADAVVMPSLTEGLPLTALEAMGLGCTLIASAVGELPELLAGGAGVLVPPGDAGALAAALRAPFPDCAAAAQQRARGYSAEAAAEAYAALYRRALPGGSAATSPSSSR